MSYDDLSWIDELKFNSNKITDTYYRIFWVFCLISLTSFAIIYFFKINPFFEMFLICISSFSIASMCLIFWHIIKINRHMKKEINARLGIKN